MLCSYIIGAESQGSECFDKKIPSIFQIQDYIENAWDQGINSTGRIETGGIRGTRKYIGTPDVSDQNQARSKFVVVDYSDSMNTGTGNVLLDRNRVSLPLSE